MLSKATIRLASIGLFTIAIAGCSRNADQAKREYMARGDQYMKENNVDAAILEYRNAIQQDPRFSDPYRKLTAVYLSRGDGADALRAATTAATLLPDVPAVQLEAGNLLLMAGQFDEAKARAQRVLTNDPKNVVARVLLGNATAGLKEFDSAMKEFEEAVRLDPHQTSAFAGLAAIQANQGDRDAAEQNFRRAIAVDPTSIPARLALAQFYWSTRQLSHAEQAMKEAIAVAPRDQRANISMAVFYQYAGRSAEAEPYLKAAFDADPNPHVTMLLADYYIGRNRMADARPLLERMSADPKFAPMANIGLSTIAESQGHADEASQIIERTLAQAPKSAVLLAAKADLLRRQNKLDEAMKVADAAVAADPSSAPAAFSRGELLVATRRNEQAEKAFEDVLRLNPHAAAASLELARLHVQAQAPDTVAVAARAVRSNPSSLDARLTLARAQMQQHDYEQAQSSLEQLARAVPTAAAPEAQLGSLLLMKNDLAGARAAFTRSIALDPLQLEALAGLTSMDLRAQHQREALERLDTLLTGAPRNSGLLLLAAGAHTSAKEYQPAEALLLRAIDVDANLLPAYSLLGRVYLAENRLDAARVQFEKVASQQERPVGALTVLGMIDQMQHRIPDAEQAFERALKADPRAGVAANNLAWLYEENGGSLDRAMELAEIAKAALPDHPEVNDTLGWIYFKKDMLPLAISTLHRGVELNPNDPTASYHLALAYEKSGNRPEARRMLQRYLALDPSSERSAEVRRRLEALQS